MIVLYFLLLFSPLLGSDFPQALEGRFRPIDGPLIEKVLVLPGKDGHSWLPLETLKQKRNLSAYPNALYRALRKAYLRKDEPQLKAKLAEGYLTLAGQPFEEGARNTLYYPTVLQLRVESLYLQVPWVMLLLISYFIALLGFALKPLRKLGWAALIVAFSIHTGMLALRCYILGRPPVSNMAETLLYVPWIATLLSWGLWYWMRSSLPLFAAALANLVLLALLDTRLSPPLDNLQAVLNSQYWLTIHVMMIVASYGIFLLSALLGHIYLLRPSEKNSQLILQTLYLGVALLIPGTLLGGVWAAQSWGRFWDWDPKESWAFISICVYLLIIHAYTFKRISNLGLAIGSIVGFQAILFTWYGVNYILGTGLHSYGFGHGGEVYYAILLLAEMLFIIYFVLARRRLIC